MSKKEQKEEQQEYSEEQEQEQSDQQSEEEDSSSEEDVQQGSKVAGPRQKSQYRKKRIKKQMKKLKKSHKRKGKKRGKKSKKSSRKKKVYSDSQSEQQQKDPHAKRILKAPPPMNPPWIHKKLRGALYDPDEVDNPSLIEKAHIEEPVLDEGMQGILKQILDEVDNPPPPRRQNRRQNVFLDKKVFETTHSAPTSFKDQNLVKKYYQNCLRSEDLSSRIKINQQKEQSDDFKVSRAETDPQQKQQECAKVVIDVEKEKKGSDDGWQQLKNKILRQEKYRKKGDPILVKPTANTVTSDNQFLEGKKVCRGFQQFATRLTPFINYKRQRLPLSLPQPKLKVLSKEERISILNHSSKYQNPHLMRKISSPSGQITNIQIIDIDGDEQEGPSTGGQVQKYK